jgi:hypothetical protein
MPGLAAILRARCPWSFRLRALVEPGVRLRAAWLASPTTLPLYAVMLVLEQDG